jgi:DNA polymerase I-like protein with 3'-5' exonuclease and polymerase domains
MNFLDSLEEATRPDVEKKPWMDDVTMELVTASTLDRVIDECIEAGRYALDLETTGLDNRYFNSVGRTNDVIVGACLSPDGKRGYYVPVRHLKGEEHNLPVDVFESALRRLVDSEAIAIFHNAKFDTEFLQFNGNAPIGEWDDPLSYEDTLILAWLRNTRERNKGLKTLSKKELGKEMIELEELFGSDARKKKDLNFANLDPSWDPCIWYACSDAICTYLLFDVLHPQVVTPDGNRNKGQEVVYRLEKMCVPATRWMERCRVWIDPEKVSELIQLGQEELFECITDVYDFCNKHLGRNIEPGWVRLFRKSFVPDNPDYNVNQQIEDCRNEAKRKGMDDLDMAGHFLKTDSGFAERYNILARQQLGPLFEELQIPDLHKTEKSEQIKTTQGEIERLNDKYGHRYPFLPKIKRLGELQKALGTYLISLHRDVAKEDGTLRVNYQQLGTDTGRFTTPSAKNPAASGGTKFPMHGTPASYDKRRPQCLLRIREAIKARPGKIMLAIDFGGVELRIATILSGEPRWLREYFRCSTCKHQFEAGDGKNTPDAPPAYCPKCGDDRIGDLHTLTGITFFGEDKVGTKAWKKMRQGAKSANFAMAYGGGPSAIIRAIEGCSEQEAARHHRAFNQTYSTLKAWWDQIKSFGRSNGYVATAFGRHYPIPDIQLPTSARDIAKDLQIQYKEKLAAGQEATAPTDAIIKQRMEFNRKFKAKAERNATNGPIQGLSADITKLAMALIYRECKKRGWLEKVLMTITIHDELVFEVDYDIAPEAVELFQDLMTRNKTILNMKWSVPLTTDCEVGHDWTVPWDIKDFKFRRVRPDGFQTDEKGRLYRDKETGEIKAKLWPADFVKIFGPVYGFAPVTENLTAEEGQKFFGDDWQPLALTDKASAPEQPLQPPPEMPQTPQTPSEGAPVVTPGVPAPSIPAVPRPHLERGEVYKYHLRNVGVGIAEKLAHVIVQCQGRGSHPLRVVGPTGDDLLWAGATIMVNPIEFETAATYHGI